MDDKINDLVLEVSKLTDANQKLKETNELLEEKLKEYKKEEKEKRTLIEKHIVVMEKFSDLYNGNLRRYIYSYIDSKIAKKEYENFECLFYGSLKDMEEETIDIIILILDLYKEKQSKK